MGLQARREGMPSPRCEARAGAGRSGTGAAGNRGGTHRVQPTAARLHPAAGRWTRVVGWLALALFVAVAVAPRAAGHTPAVEPAATPVASPIVRLHIVAHSDAARDQAVKLQVRDALLPLLTAAVAGARTPEQVLDRVAGVAPQLEDRAEAVVRRAGLPYAVRVEIGSFPFDRRQLDGFVYPAGTYPAVRVVLGSGQGHNFWCVLFPGLCRLGDGGPAVAGADPAMAAAPADAVAASAPGTPAGVGAPAPGTGAAASGPSPQPPDLVGTAGAGVGAASAASGPAAVDASRAGTPPATRWFLVEWWRGSIGRWWASLAASQRAAAAR